MYIGDTYNSRIRKVTVSTGVITTIAGTGTGSYSGDGGAATSAALYQPEGVALDSSGTQLISTFLANFSYVFISLLGNVYIADYSNHRIRKVTVSTGIITTIAGSGGTGSYSGDNGQATAAALYDPRGVTVDTSG